MADLAREIDLLRTKCWYDTASKFIGGADTPKSPNWFAKKFKRETHQRRKDGLTDWKKYRWGKSVPIKKNGYFAVDRVAEKYPGTDRIFKALFWSVLKSEDVSISAIEAEISALGTRVSIRRNLNGDITRDSMNSLSDYVTETEPHGLIGRIIFDDNFWQKGVSISLIQEAMLACLEDMADFDVLQALVLMLAWADKRKYGELWNEISDFYSHLIPWFIMDEDIPFRFELLDKIDAYAKKRKLIPFRKPPCTKGEWKEQLPRYHILLSEHYAANFRMQKNSGILPKDIFADSVCEELAKALVEGIAGEEKPMEKCRDLWKPFSWELAKVSRGHYGNKEKFRENLNKEIGYFLDERSRPKDYQDSFFIGFRG